MQVNRGNRWNYNGRSAGTRSEVQVDLGRWTAPVCGQTRAGRSTAGEIGLEEVGGRADDGRRRSRILPARCVVGAAFEREETLGSPSFVVDQRSAPVRDQLIRCAVNEQKWRRLREVIVARGETLSRAGHHDGSLHPGVVAARVGYQAQCGDRSVRGTGGTDLLRVHKPSEGPIRL